MRLSTYILDNIEPILQEWEDFAKTLFPADQSITVKELRDHASKVLVAIAHDLERSQTSTVQSDKSKGLLVKDDEINTAAEDHGIQRVIQGLSIIEMISEYRALRASVIRLFSKSDRAILLSDPNDLVRFNEAIDQEVAESVYTYSTYKDKQTRIFESMLSSIPDLSYTLDLDGNITYMNLAMTYLYDKPKHEILGKAIYNTNMPAVADMREHIQYIIKTKKECHGEVVYKDKSGNHHFF